MKERAKYKLGERVICIKYDINEIFTFTNDGMFLENRVEKDYFGREAIISDIQRQEIETEYGKIKQDVDEYKINFTDEIGGSLAWVDGKELIPLCIKPLGIRLSVEDVPPGLNENDHCHIGGWVIGKDRRK